MKKKIILAASVVLSIATAMAAFGGTTAPAAAGARAALAAKTLDLPSMLAWALQDERIARMEYRVVLDALGEVRPFSNIIRAEETHIGWLADLFAAQGLALPKDTTVVPAAPRDLASALEAGRQAEIDNIAMYDRFLAQSLPADVRRVFEQLKAASENHLRAFVTNAGRKS